LGEDFSIYLERNEVKNLFNWITSTAWDETQKWIYGEMVKFLGNFFMQMNNMGADLFELSWIKAIVLFFSYFGWALYITGLVVAVFDTAIQAQTGRGDIKGTALNFIKGFFAVCLFTTVPIELYKTCISMQGILTDGLSGLLQTKTMNINELANNALSINSLVTPSLYNIFLVIALGYCIIKIFFANIKRGGILLIQISVGSLYMFSVPRGYMDGFVGWCKQVIALCLTAFLQTTILIAGLITWQSNFLLGIGLMLSAAEVERIAGMFGLDTSVKGNMMGAVYATQSIVNITKSIASKVS
jgi:hypothetical protein